MDSILNVGVNSEIIQRLAAVTANPRFAYDLHRRFLQMYGTIVMKVPTESYTQILDEYKARDGVSHDSELSEESLQRIILRFEDLAAVPTDPHEQLRRAIEAIFCSYYSPRYICQPR